jgi:hypothetical protein
LVPPSGNRFAGWVDTLPAWLANSVAVAAIVGVLYAFSLAAELVRVVRREPRDASWP